MLLPLSCFLSCLSLELYKHLGSVWGLSFCVCTNVTKQDPDTKGQKWCSAVGSLGRGRKQKQKHFEEGALNLSIGFRVWGFRALKLGLGVLRATETWWPEEKRGKALSVWQILE